MIFLRVGSEVGKGASLRVAERLLRFEQRMLLRLLMLINLLKVVITNSCCTILILVKKVIVIISIIIGFEENLILAI